jgi:flagellar basal-body rod protein FlgB
MKIFDDTLARLERSLDVRLIRHGVLSGNIANSETPGYKPKDVDFASVMGALPAEGGGELGRTNAAHLDASGVAAAGAGAGVDPAEVRVVETGGSSPSFDGNGVDIDKTMSSLAENALQYGAGARAAAKKLAILRYTVTDGNG